MAGVGRPTKLTPEVQQAVVDALKRTYYLETAASLAGIEYRTFRRWVKKGRQSKSGIHFEFCQAIKKALAEKEADNIRVVEDAGSSQWQARAWLLERASSERWGKDKEQVKELVRAVKELQKAHVPDRHRPEKEDPAAPEAEDGPDG